MPEQQKRNPALAGANFTAGGAEQSERTGKAAALQQSNNMGTLTPS